VRFVPDAILGVLDEFTERFYRRYSAELDSIETPTAVEIDAALSNLSLEQLGVLKTAIRDHRSLLVTNPAYGNEIIAISKQILAFGGAGIGLAAAFSQKVAEIPPTALFIAGVIAIFYVNLVLLSLSTIFVFVWQSRFRYPFLYFRKIGNAFPFFYYQSISPETPRQTFQTADQKMNAAKLYATDLIRFLSYHLDNYVPAVPARNAAKDAANEPSAEDAKVRRRLVRDELQQYFLILSYQGYVNQYEVKMNNQFLYGLIGSTAGAVAIAIVIWLK
jgi:hypothetical protein